MVTGKRYDVARIRELLTYAFSDVELRRLCYDVPDFRPVYDEVAAGTSMREIADKLIEHAEKWGQIDTLLALAKAWNPRQYEEIGPYYLEDPTPDLEKQVAELSRRLAAITAESALTEEQQYQIALHWIELGSQDSLRGFALPRRDLRAVSLSGAELRQVHLSGASLNFADLKEADLGEAELADADLSGADLTAANLEGANLGRSNLSEAVLNRAILRLAKADGAILNKADLSGADLSGADLRGADLRGAKLSEANLSGAKLSGADLCEADLGGADLSGADLTDQQLAAARSLEDAIMPDGTRHE